MTWVKQVPFSRPVFCEYLNQVRLEGEFVVYQLYVKVKFCISCFLNKLDSRSRDVSIIKVAFCPYTEYGNSGMLGGDCCKLFYYHFWMIFDSRESLYRIVFLRKILTWTKNQYVSCIVTFVVCKLTDLIPCKNRLSPINSVNFVTISLVWAFCNLAE